MKNTLKSWLVKNQYPVYDELIDANQNPRPIATKLIDHPLNIGLDELKKRQKDAEKIIAKHGISFVVYSQRVTLTAFGR